MGRGRGWFGGEDSTAAEQKPLKSSKYGPQDLEDRRCTDVFCLIMFVLSLLTVFTTSIMIFVRGDINDIRYGVDYAGNRCGTGVNHGKKKLWYPRIGEDVAEQSIVLSTRPWDIVLYGICVPACPQFDAAHLLTITDPYAHTTASKASSWPVGVSTLDMINRCYPDPESVSTSISVCAQPNCTSVGAPCFHDMPGLVPTTTWKIDAAHPESLCSAKLDIEEKVTRKQSNAGSYLDSVFSSVSTVRDVWESLVDNWSVIAGFGVGMTTLLNFTWLILLYLFAGIAVWTCIWVVSGALTLATLLAYIKAGVASDLISKAMNTTQAADVLSGSGGSTINSLVSSSDQNERWIWWTAAITLSVVALLWMLFVCCSRKAIDRCIVLIKEGCTAFGTSYGLAGLPWFICILQIAVFFYCVLTLAVLTTFDANGSYSEHIQKLGDAYINTVTSPSDFLAVNLTGHAHPLVAGLTTSQQQWIFGSIVGFGLIWTYAFLTCVGLMTIAACVFYFYYVNKDTVPSRAYLKQFDDNQTRFPVIKHLGWVLRYHIGSMALGSFIVAVVTVIQIVTKGIFEWMKKNGGNNQMVKVVSMCIQCCLACFKRTIEFINSYAYVYVFLENVGFCTGASHTFQLMLRYPAQIAINTTVQRVLGLLQLLLVPGGVTLFADFYFNVGNTHTASGGLLLTGAVLVSSLLMTRAFSSVFEQVIQSLTVCVLHDVDTFDGRFLRESMKEAFGDPQKPKD